MTPLRIVFAALCLMLTMPVLVLTVQVALSIMVRVRATRGSVVAPRPRIAVLVPAHNESNGITACLAVIGAQLRHGDRLLVVADNCDDDTATRARNRGAEVIERRDPARRGKGHALDFGVRHLAIAPPDVVVVVDADCLLHEGALEQLARRSAASDRPAQALYLMHAPPHANLKLKIAEFAWRVKNHARAMGYHRLGLPCQLMGTGMAFPWRLLRDANLASGHLVEDLKLGLELAEQGQAPRFCPEALVTSVFPSSSEGMRTQRTRWEHGHLGMLSRYGPYGLWRSLATRNVELLALVIDLCVPPLALLTLAVLASCGIGLTLWGLTGTALPWLLALVNLGLLAVTLLLAWICHGRDILTLSGLAYAPVYALGKVPIYLGFLIRRQVEWVRSRRD
jgi:cellulose synthase/poly-beta-1,6-N-acetylglucosamine synthase-like glycosyltransferase